MPKFLLYYVKDDEEVPDVVEEGLDGARLMGIYDDPKNARKCECGGQGNNRGHGYSADHETGAITHSACSGIVWHWRSGYGTRLFGALGVNELPRSLTPKALRNPTGWGVE